MSFFDSVKKSLGISKEKRNDTDSNSTQFELTFHEEKLGIGISKYTGDMSHMSGPQAGVELSCPIVTSMEGKKHDVQPGDLIIALEGNPISSFDDFTSIIKAIGRPVRIRFLRRRQASAPPASNSSSTGSASSSGLGGMNPLKMLSGLGASTPVVTAPSQKAAPPVLSEEEKQARREKLSAAAQDRSQSWDRKLGQKKHSAGGTSPREGQALQQPQPEEAVSAETERAIQRAKAAERKIEKDLGYSPFRPHMSFTSSSSSTTAATVTNNTNNTATTAAPNTVANSGAANLGAGVGVARQNPFPSALAAAGGAGEEAEALAAEELAVEADVDDALAMLLSLGEEDQETGKVAVSTVAKMLGNLCDNPGELKLRSIRVSNKAFQSKVACAPGASELLIAAGYAYSCPSSKGTRGSGGAAGLPVPPIANGTAVAPSAEEELFLVHPMDAPSVRRLHYTLFRLQDLLTAAGVEAADSTSGSPRAAPTR